MSYLPERRVGLVTPSANPAFEPELRALLPERIAVHATRLGVMPKTTLAERNDRYIATYEAALSSYGDLKLDAVAIGLTGPSYALPPDDDVALQARLSDHAATPVVLPSRAIASALAATGLRRVVIFSPYPGWLTDRAVGYWTASGMEIATVFKVSETFRAYELTPAEVMAALRQVPVTEDCAVIMSGTGMPTLDALAEFSPVCPALLLPSNLAVAWALHRALRLPASPTLRALAPRLAAVL
jgi:maleate isomerase